MNATRTPMLSVTVSNYNYAAFLPRTIESILAQTYTDFELIVIDNASTDDSVAVLRKYAEIDPRVRIIEHERNVGGLASFRESCDVARGRYRVHVDADDWVIAPDAFARQIEMLEHNPRMSFTYSCMTMYGPGDEKIHVTHPFSSDRVMPGHEAVEAILGLTLTHSGMMIRLDAYRATPGYPDGYSHVLDMLLALQLCEVGDVGYIDDELYAFRQHGSNVHLQPQLSIVSDEYFPVIRAAFNGPLGPELPLSMRRRAVQLALLHMPTHYIFKGELRDGWRMWWQSFRIRPGATLLERRNLGLVVRTLFGDRTYRSLRNCVGALRHSATRQRVAEHLQPSHPSMGPPGTV